MAGEKFGEFDKSSVISQTKTIQILLIIITLWLNLSICQTFPRQTLITVNSPNFPAIRYMYVRMYVYASLKDVHQNFHHNYIRTMYMYTYTYIYILGRVVIITIPASPLPIELVATTENV